MRIFHIPSGKKMPDTIVRAKLTGFWIKLFSLLPSADAIHTVQVSAFRPTDE